MRIGCDCDIIIVVIERGSVFVSLNNSIRGIMMTEADLNKIIAEIESRLTGDPEKDADIWNEWGEKYRGDPDAEPLMTEISHRIFALFMEEEGDLPQEIFNNLVETAEEDYAEACRLIERHEYDEALGKLLVLTSVIRAYPLSDEMIWMDFNSYLDSLVYQDYFEDTIGDKEIGRHPMHPGRILFTTGSLLIEMGRAEEALEPLEMLVSLDPVCPTYLFELGEAYKRTGRIEEAAQNAVWSLSCASTNRELARAYRDLAYCMTEIGAYEDALMLYHLSLRYLASHHAQVEIAWIQKKIHVSPVRLQESEILKRCEELGIPVGMSETVENNLNLLEMMSGDPDK